MMDIVEFAETHFDIKLNIWQKECLRFMYADWYRGRNFYMLCTRGKKYSFINDCLIIIDYYMSYVQKEILLEDFNEFKQEKLKTYRSDIYVNNQVSN